MEKTYVVNISGKSFSKYGSHSPNDEERAISPQDEQEETLDLSYRDNSHLSNPNNNNTNTNNNNKPYACDLCDKCFAQKSHLKQHLVTHSGEKPFKCQVCGDSFSRNGNLTRHMGIHGKTISNGSPKSSVCHSGMSREHSTSYQTSSYSKPKSSKVITANDKPFKCQICPCSFSRNGDLTRHLRTHGTSLPSLSHTANCKVSTSSSSASSPLSTNQSLHHIQNPFNCDVCWETFTHRAKLSQDVHKRIHKALNPFQCESCGKCFSQRTHLTVHRQRIHSNGKTLNNSDKPSMNNNSSSAPLQSSNEKNNDNPLSCDVCWKAYSQRNHHDLHKRIHSAVLPFKCNICSQVFTDRGEWKRHQRSHLGKKLYSCSLCNKTFLERSHLKVHHRTHTGERPFKCGTCQFAFARKDHLERHLRANKCNSKMSDESRNTPDSNNASNDSHSDLIQLHSHHHHHQQHQHHMSDHTAPSATALVAANSVLAHSHHSDTSSGALVQTSSQLDIASSNTPTTDLISAANNTQMYPATIQMYPTSIQLYSGAPVFPTIQGATFLCI